MKRGFDAYATDTAIVCAFAGPAPEKPAAGLSAARRLGGGVRN
jgi:hypothetical protein